MTITTKQYDSAQLVFGKLTPDSVAEHLKLYNAYAANATTIYNTIHDLPADTVGYSVIRSELSRRFSFEYNGVLNHEKFFDQFVGGAQPLQAGSLLTMIEQQWGSFDRWQVEFVALAKTRGVGWAVLYYDANRNLLLHTWVDEQHLGHLNGCTFVMGIDAWEHSFAMDYSPTGRPDYITDAVSALNWDVIAQRVVTN